MMAEKGAAMVLRQRAALRSFSQQASAAAMAQQQAAAYGTAAPTTA